MKSFKTSASTSEAAATSALEGLNIDEDGLSDEYDFMDDAADGGARERRREPSIKYVDMLQKVADRELPEVCIELDDLEAVSTWLSITGRSCG